MNEKKRSLHLVGQSNLKTKFTIVVFIALAAFDHTIIGLFPPTIPIYSKRLAGGNR